MMERAAHFQKEKMIEGVPLISRLILDTRQKKKIKPKTQNSQTLKKKSNQKIKYLGGLSKGQVVEL